MTRFLDDAGAFEHKMRALDGGACFFDPERFTWIAGVQAGWRAVRAEADGLLRALDILPGFEDIQPAQQAVTNDGRWKVVPLLGYGHAIEQNLRRCPLTAQVLSQVPGLRSAMFSILLPGKELPPHRGPYAGVLRYHLGLKVPQPESQCGITVGEHTRHWHEGRSLVFDDSHLHRAWNHSADTRVVLFVDFDRPLPPALARRNEEFLQVIGQSPFMLDGLRQWQAWEAAHGAQLDRLLSLT